ncbi:MAG TPA: hypothetical protein VK599_06345 [Streptosporangiaceae bacterium]|nr:hypothetical protein [Streptosporangiaceae bacterium]
MLSWWHRDVIAAGKLPLMLCFLAFVLTFATTRTITRLIREGRGPFRNQVTASGTHIHHAVPGLILHLQDVYWSGEGQVSVEAVSLTAACLGLALVGFSPFGVENADSIEVSLRLTATGVVAADGVLAVICVLKGKYRSALFGFFLPPVGLVSALRLARPTSVWARHWYHGPRLERAGRRAARFDRRWRPALTGWEDFLGGKPSRPNPPPPAPDGTDHDA